MKIQTTDGNVYEGEVFAIDPDTKTIVLKTESTYVVINSNLIAQLHGDFSTVKTPQIAELGISPSAIQKREMIALKQTEKNIEALNNNVSSDIQALYDRMSLLYPCRWDNVTIVILDEYVIKPPYEEVTYKGTPTATTTTAGGTTATVTIGGSKEALDRIVKILDNEKKKLKI